MKQLLKKRVLSWLLHGLYLMPILMVFSVQANTVNTHSMPPSFQLSPAEQQWVEDNPNIKVIGDPDWFPFEGFDENGQYIGIVAEVLNEINRKTQLDFTVYNTSNWLKTLKLAAHSKADIISASQSNDYLAEHYKASYSTIQNPVVMVGKENMHYISNLSAIKGEKVALLGNSGYGHELIKRYPDNNFIQVDSVIDGLLGVAEGRYDVVLLSMARASYKMAELGLYQLRVVGITDVNVKLTLFVNKEKPLLWSIVNKAKLSETPQERQQILAKWIKYKYVDRSHFSKNFILFLMLTTLLIFAVLYKVGASLNARKIKQLANKDTLTGLYNRAFVKQQLIDESHSSDQYRTIFSLILIDIDNFKLVNDSLGHETADKVLQKIASLLTQSFDNEDVLGRWAGQEFLILCPCTNTQEALNKVEFFRRLLATTIFPQNIAITTSVGVAQHKNREPIDGCLNLVDAALYQAKERGGNCVESF